MLAQTSPVLIRVDLRQADFNDYVQMRIHRIYLWPTGHSLIQQVYHKPR